MKKSSKGKYRDIEYESDEEKYFLYWAFELLDKGYIESIQRANSFLLSKELSSKYIKKTNLKTRIKEEIKDQIFLNKHIYTPEYKIIWDVVKMEKFVNDEYSDVMDEKNIKPLLNTFEKLGGRITYIECKPKFDQNNMTRLFKINQKWMWDKYRIFVNLVIPEKLFESTFTPEAYKLTATGKQKKINFKIKTLNEFLNE